MKFALLSGEEQQLFRMRLAIIGGVVAVALFALLFRIWFMQIVDGDLYRELAQGNRIRVVPQEAPRGIIYDRNGTILAYNRPAFNIQLVREDAPDLQRTLENLSLVTGYPYADLEATVQENRTPYKFKPLLLLADIGRKTADLVETYQEDLPGISVTVEPKRLYPTAYIASHVIGYVGQITKPQLKALPISKVQSGRIVGHAGVELVENNTLIGTDGGRQVEVDHVGRELRVLGDPVNPEPGSDLYLSVDLKLQQYVKTLMSGKEGVVIVMRTQTGEILSMNSFPDFDPNIFVGRIDEETWNKITRSEKEVLINKAIAGIYPPGSTFKMLVALAALDMGVITPETIINCPGYFRVGRDIRYCWRRGGHGDMDLVNAIAQSCNVFFYQAGLLVGVDELERYARMFGFGDVTGLETDSEKPGLVPTRRWKERVYKERWYDGETAQLSIGQGALTVTPIQLATYVNAIANRGVWVQPSIVRRIVSTDGNVLLSEDALPHRTRLLPIDVANLDLVQEGMWAAVNARGGTARRAQSKIVDIAGKTGTSQVVGRRLRSAEEGLEEDESLLPHSLFVSFAPRRNPEITVLVLVEHGKSGGETAAPIGRRVIEYYFQEIHTPGDGTQTLPVQTAEWKLPRDPHADHAHDSAFTRRLAEAFASAEPALSGSAAR